MRVFDRSTARCACSRRYGAKAPSDARAPHRPAREAAPRRLLEEKQRSESRDPSRLPRALRTGSDCDTTPRDARTLRGRHRTARPAMPSSRSRSRGGDDRLREGDEVEADYRGKGKYYPARVARVHRDGTVDVKYDDGDREAGVPPRRCRKRGGGAGAGALREATRSAPGRPEGRSKGCTRRPRVGAHRAAASRRSR